MDFIFTTKVFLHMIFKSLVGKIWPKAIYYSKKVEFLTINCIFEGLLSATELEQSSKETLDYVAHLT